MIATLRSTGEKVPFTEINIGEPFLYRDRFWTRTDRYSGTDLAKGPGSYGACSFTYDPATRGAVGPSEDRFLERSASFEVERVEVTLEPGS